MSYEGYTEFLCKNGHHWEICVYDSEIDYPPCYRCGKYPVWQHDVDETNGTVPAKLVVDHYEQIVMNVPVYVKNTGPAKLVVDHYKQVVINEPIYVVPKV